MNAAESDLRSDTCIAVMALMTWAEFHGGRDALIGNTIERFVAAGGPDDPGITRALVKVRSHIARYIEQGGAVPSWFPPSLLALIRDSSWCEPELPRSPAPKVDATPDDKNGDEAPRPDGFSYYR